MILEKISDPQKYIIHHLNHLQIDLRCFKFIKPGACSSHYWILNIDSIVFSLVLGSCFFEYFLYGRKTSN